VEILFIRVILGKHQVVVSGKDFATKKKGKSLLFLEMKLLKFLSKTKGLSYLLFFAFKQ